MKIGDSAFFYHSNCKEPGIAGTVDIVKEYYPDHTQFDPKDPHFDPKSSESDPRWIMVDVKFNRHLDRFVTLKELKALHQQHKKQGKGPLANLSLFTTARLSVQSLTKTEFEYVLKLSEDAES